MKVTAYGDQYDCATAVKGSNFIKLYDESGHEIVAFEGIRDFSFYSFDGEYSTPEKPQIEIMQETIDTLVLTMLGV